MKIMGLEQIADFKQFLNAHVSDVGAVALAVTACILILSFAAREILTWMTRTDKIRKDLQSLELAVKNLEKKLSENQKPSETIRWAVEEKAPEPETFKLNH